MNCKNCNAVMRPDHERKVFVCPYCDNTEPFEGVSKEEIQGMLHDAIHDVRMESIKEAKETLQREAESGGDTRSKKQRVKDVIFFTFAFIACLFLALIVIGTLASDQYYTAGFIAVAQMLLLIVGMILKAKSLSDGPKKAKYKKHSKRCIGIAALLIMAWVFAIGFSESSPIDSSMSSRSYSWPKQGLGSDLPEPEGELTYVHSSTTVFQADVNDYDQERFTDYVQACKDCGYDVDATETNTSYEAYNENDDYIKITFSSYSRKPSINIWIEKAISMDDFYWPASFDGYPVPEAEKCYVKNMRTDSHSNSLEIYVGEVTRQEFMDYVSKCIEEGYEGSYNEGTDSFYGRKSENTTIRVEFTRGRIMYIDIWDKK